RPVADRLRDRGVRLRPRARRGGRELQAGDRRRHQLPVRQPGSVRADIPPLRGHGAVRFRGGQAERRLRVRHHPVGNAATRDPVGGAHARGDRTLGSRGPQAARPPAVAMHRPDHGVPVQDSGTVLAARPGEEDPADD
ncbi:MAG: hypothetical protein BJ554DRAFT_3223, partial [Olpidium bornovanus]